jgi:hypothetical protein
MGDNKPSKLMNPNNMFVIIRRGRNKPYEQDANK